MAQRVKLVPTIGAEIPNLDFTFMLGNNTAESATITDKDIGKAVKIVGDSRVAFCADGDEIAGQLISVEPNQTSGGYKVGTVRAVNSPLFDATLANATALAIGDELVAAAQAAIGTPNGTPPYHVRMLVKKATTALGGGQRLKVVAFQSGAGANGSTLTASKIFG